MAGERMTCPACGRDVAMRKDGTPHAHKPRKGALDNCPAVGRVTCEDCGHSKWLHHLPCEADGCTCRRVPATIR